ncbi:MAG TPA: glycosyltransferase family protein [Pirellulaceae bacterium]|nr:glycosyltransferase family protein [Pirellulaceae bacterium]
MHRVVAIVQARMGSTRLPGKVLQTIGHQPMLDWVMNRLHRCRRVEQVVVATTDREWDQVLVDYCRDRGWSVFCGPENDVLQRYLEAATWSNADVVVRVTADCPLIDPKLIDDVVDRLCQTRHCEYVSNFYPERRFPRGLDCEAFFAETLHRAARLIGEASRYREHVTLYLYEHPQLFALGEFTADDDWSHLRWTVDTLADWELMEAVATWFGRDDFCWQDVLAAYTDNPHWLSINNEVAQKVA